MDKIECISLYGKINWDIEDTNKFVEGMKDIFALLNITATQYGYCEIPFQKYGPRMGSPRNVSKKISSLYSNGLKLKTLEFFALPKNYAFQYSDYFAYFARGVDYLVIAFDPTQCNMPDIKLLLTKMNEHISAVWGEHFRIPKGDQPLTHCMDEFSRNPLGSNTQEVEIGEAIQIIKRFTF